MQDDALVARIAQSFARQAMMATLGARLVEVGPGRAVIELPLAPHLGQQQGWAHAGATFAIGDSAAGYAALSLMPAEQEVVTIEMKINLLAPAVGDRLLAEGRVVRAGRRVSVVTAEVFAERDGARKAVALLQGTTTAVPAG
ncbi:PaaI family thioesterase [Frigidibacter sp. MR17.24]|uniref:PaaI family thioesterase n=1 Tax=Frigidibacter sp. MR17.24 TaxID=3127345 RepID=UPI0030130C6C